MTATVNVRRTTQMLLVLSAMPFLFGFGTTPVAKGAAPAEPALMHDPVTQRTAEFQAATVKPVAPAPAPEPAPAAPKRLATAAGVELVTVSPEASVHGFHEGSTRSLEMTPVGVAGANERGITLPANDDAGVEYVIMASRGRATSPTSAVDIALAEGHDVTSPVTGTVVDVSRYALYGNTSDVMIRIQPDANPDVHVTVFHVVDPTVQAGDKLTAGETVLAAGPRALPFGSQIDRFVGAAGPHVHIQVDPAA